MSKTAYLGQPHFKIRDSLVIKDNKDVTGGVHQIPSNDVVLAWIVQHLHALGTPVARNDAAHTMRNEDSANKYCFKGLVSELLLAEEGRAFYNYSVNPDLDLSKSAKQRLYTPRGRTWIARPTCRERCLCCLQCKGGPSAAVRSSFRNNPTLKMLSLLRVLRSWTRKTAGPRKNGHLL